MDSIARIADNLAVALRLALRYRRRDDVASRIAVIEKANPALAEYDARRQASKRSTMSEDDKLRAGLASPYVARW